MKGAMVPHEEFVLLMVLMKTPVVPTWLKVPYAP